MIKNQMAYSYLAYRWPARIAEFTLSSFLIKYDPRSASVNSFIPSGKLGARVKGAIIFLSFGNVRAAANSAVDSIIHRDGDVEYTWAMFPCNPWKISCTKKET